MTKMFKWGAALASCVVLSSWSLPVAFGSEVLASGPTPPAFSLSLSPTRVVIGPADIGKTQQIQVLNGGTSSESVTVQKENFVGSPDGSLKFQASAPYSASDWVTVTPATFVLAPGATQVVTATVAVPARPEPGDHEVALVFLVPAGTTGANIKVNRGVATPVYITVAGPTTDTAMLSHLHASGFAIGGPVTISATIDNTGSVHRDFRGSTPLKVTGAGSVADFPDFTVIRGSTRIVTTTWSPPLFCICHPSVSVVNAGGVVSSMTIRVIVVPLPLIGFIAGAAALLLLAVHLSRRGYRISVRNAAAAMLRPVSSGDA